MLRTAFRRAAAVLSVALLWATLGCGDPTPPTAVQGPRPRPAPRPGVRPQPAPPRDDLPRGKAPTRQPGEKDVSETKRPQPSPKAILEDLLDRPETPRSSRPGYAAPREFSAATLQRAGVRKMGGRYLTLYTDLPPSPEVEAILAAFDQAVPQWAEYFKLQREDYAGWRMNCFLMQEADRFQTHGLMPRDLPPFLHGYQRGRECWVFEQPSPYYRRHLVLHEGVHGFMEMVLGGLGPPWYAEGMAELLATHRWTEAGIVTRYFPQSREEVSQWGRIKLVREAFAAGRGRMPEAILSYGATAHQDVEPYGWCWALCAFLDGHPRYQRDFRQLPSLLNRSPAQFNALVPEQFGDRWKMLLEEWKVFVATLDYGYDVSEAEIELAGPAPVLSATHTVEVAANRFWQSAGVRLEAGQRYRISAAGVYTLADAPRPWRCEPQGVTIHYVDGGPLGMLLGAIAVEGQDFSTLIRPDPIGAGREFKADVSGVLYLRINERPGGLGDNTGSLRVQIELVGTQ